MLRVSRSPVRGVVRPGAGFAHPATREPLWESCLVQIGMLGPLEVRTDDGVLADVPGDRLSKDTVLAG